MFPLGLFIEQKDEFFDKSKQIILLQLLLFLLGKSFSDCSSELSKILIILKDDVTIFDLVIRA